MRAQIFLPYYPLLSRKQQPLKFGNVGGRWSVGFSDDGYLVGLWDRIGMPQHGCQIEIHYETL